MQPAEAVLRKEIEGKRTPSVQYAFFDREKVIFDFSAGYADLESGTKMDAGIAFHAYSVTKTFTALSVMQLAEQNLLKLGDPVRDRLPEAPVGSRVTIRHLLTHTSGLPNPLPMKWVHLETEHDGFDRDAFFREIFLKIRPGNEKPNTRYRYSNLGYVLLGQIIEAISKSRFEEYVKRHILGRLDLRNGYLGFDILPGKQHATGYHPSRSLSMLLMGLLFDTGKYMGKTAGRWRPFRPLHVNGTPHGGMTGNTMGFVRYGQELLRDDCSLISFEGKRQLFTENLTDSGKPTGMCLSWHKGNLNGNGYYTHAGGGGGFYCELRLYPAKHSGSFVIFNRSGFSDVRFLDKVDTALLQS